MAKIRNISEHALSVSPLDGRVVEPDHVTDVPDDIFKAYVWPETLWSVVTVKASTKVEE